MKVSLYCGLINYGWYAEMKISHKKLVKEESTYSGNFFYWLFIALLDLIACIFLKKRGTTREFILMVLSVAAPLSVAIRNYFAFRALEKGNFYLKKCVVDFYSYPFARIDGKLRKCEVPYDIESDECYLVANADFSYFIMPVNAELDEFLKNRIIRD